MGDGWSGALSDALCDAPCNAPLPHHKQAASRIQLAALVQLQFTYMTAALFFDRDDEDMPDEYVGVGLVEQRAEECRLRLSGATAHRPSLLGLGLQAPGCALP